jgi:hypothetical protein
VTRHLLIWTLLALVPLANVRMICFDHDGVSAARSLPAGADCDDTCPREKPADQETGCLLVAGGCSAVMAFVVALSSPTTVFAPPLATSHRVPDTRDLYTAPVLRTFSPPPEA